MSKSEYKKIELSDLVLLTQKGDIKALEEIIRRKQGSIYSIFAHLVSKKEDVSDLTQEVFLKFFNGLHKTEINNIKYYLVTTAKNIAVTFLRNKQQNFELDERILFENLCEKEEGNCSIIFGHYCTNVFTTFY